MATFAFFCSFLVVTLVYAMAHVATVKTLATEMAFKCGIHIISFLFSLLFLTIHSFVTILPHFLYVLLNCHLFQAGNALS